MKDCEEVENSAEMSVGQDGATATLVRPNSYPSVTGNVRETTLGKCVTIHNSCYL